MITEENREKMIGIAKPFMIDGCADPFEKDTYLTLLSRIGNKESAVGNIILECMFLAYEKGRISKLSSPKEKKK